MSESNKLPVDWESIEREYRAGVLSLRQIANAHSGVSHVTIKTRADKECWVRDLSSKIKDSADAKLNRDALNSDLTAKSSVKESEVVEANATMQADIIRSHRKDITRSRTLSMALLTELEATTGDPELFRQIGELLYASDDKGMDKLNEIYRKVISMPSRIDGMKKLAETLKTLIGMEREAFGIDKEGDGAAKSVADAIRAACGNS